MLTDLVAVILLVIVIVRGRDTGLVRQLFMAGGFVTGLFIGAMLQPYAMQYADTTLSRALLSLVVTLGSALALAHVGEAIGDRLKHHLERLVPLNKLDAWLGSLAGAVTMLVAIWLLTPLLSSIPSPGIQQSLQNSLIVSSLSRTLPPAPQVVSSIERLINPNGFPDVFAGIERKPLQPDAPLPSLGSLESAVTSTRPSIVKLEGRGCGGIVDGSGFVAAQNVIISNAHVVAGVDKPSVVDTNGRHNATVIWFDSGLDMAVLRVSPNAKGLAGPPLKLDAETKANGTPGVVVGYPNGGGFTASPATILDQFTATGRDIYGRGNTKRSIYEVRADVVPGNSGGPLIDAEGEVIGLVFAESTNYRDIAYVLTLKPVTDGLQQALARNQPVSTGACAE